MKLKKIKEFFEDNGIIFARILTVALVVAVAVPVYSTMSTHHEYNDNFYKNGKELNVDESYKNDYTSEHPEGIEFGGWRPGDKPVEVAQNTVDQQSTEAQNKVTKSIDKVAKSKVNLDAQQLAKTEEKNREKNKDKNKDKNKKVTEVANNKTSTNDNANQPKPSTEKSTQKPSTEKSTQKKKLIIHHPAEKGEVWVVDKPAWDEEVDQYEDKEVEVTNPETGETTTTTEKVKTGTKTVHHPAEGHNETVVTKEAWDEEVEQ